MTQKLIFVERTAVKPGDWTLTLPKGARVLSVQNQRGRLALWFEFAPGEKGKTTRAFRVVVTGERFELPDGSAFLGTVQFYDGDYIVHVYEVPI